MKRTEETKLYRNDLIRGEMARQGITVERFMAETGFCPWTVTNLRKGVNVTVRTLVIAAAALNMPVSSLFEFANSAENVTPVAA